MQQVKSWGSSSTSIRDVNVVNIDICIDIIYLMICNRGVIHVEYRNEQVVADLEARGDENKTD